MNYTETARVLREMRDNEDNVLAIDYVALTAAADLCERCAWRPIGTAPKDGTWILGGRDVTIDKSGNMVGAGSSGGECGL